MCVVAHAHVHPCCCCSARFLFVSVAAQALCSLFLLSCVARLTRCCMLHALQAPASRSFDLHLADASDREASRLRAASAVVNDVLVEAEADSKSSMR